MNKFQKEEKRSQIKGYAEIVAIQLPRRDRLEGLAEEAAELCKAALKSIRAEGLSENFTPVSDKEAHENLKEEFMDVIMCAATLKLLPEEINLQFSIEKWERWVRRLGVDPEVKERVLRNFASESNT